MYVDSGENTASAYDLAHRFSEQLGEVNPALIKQDHESATVDVRKDHRYWRVASFRRSGQAVLITYTCNAADEEQDRKLVEGILNSFEWDGPTN